MTTEHDSNDWLSTFLDGEMTADERAATERRLTDDPVARQDLEEYREIGSLLRSLPSHEPPAGFSTVVMQRCERESLLPAETAVAGSIGAATPQSNRATVAVVVSLLATAAMLFLLVKVVSPPGTSTRNREASSDPTPNKKLARAETGKEKALMAKSQTERAADSAKATAAGAGRTPAGTKPTAAATIAAKTKARNFSKYAAPSPNRSLARPGSAGGQNKDEARPVAGPFLSRLRGRSEFGGFGGGGAGRFEMGDRQSGIRIGDVVPYLQLSEDRTAVIEVTVVDVNHAVGRLEVLLEHKLVTPLTKSPPRKKGLLKKSGAKSKLLTMKSVAMDDKSRTGRSELIAVYVESTQAQLAQVMRELDKETQSLHVSLRPPVALGDVRLKTNGDRWAALFRRDRRRSPQTLADAADFGRRAVAAGTFWKTQRGAKTLSQPGGAPKDELKTKGNRKNDKSAKQSLEKKDGNAAVKRKPVGRGRGNKKPAGLTAGADAATAASRSFQLRLKLSDQPAARNESSKNGRKKEKPHRRFKPRGQRAHVAGKPRAGRESAASRPVQVIFVFRKTSPPQKPVRARRP